MDEKRYYILFPSYTWGLQLEALLKGQKIKYTIVPTPRELSECCGISIMYNENDETKIKSLIEENSIKISGFRSLIKEKKNIYLDK
ncbi:DUF3343 domain-containing protein [Oxobacter pfennigii]|uniref:DUF3343 domain-containing protein n=1 Tax=Oxobacter pfennigii TaxID=36849 RepID=UPI0006D3D2A4|nr:DUF3343 domain-containing protein [Oxobacter pfennigii]